MVIYNTLQFSVFAFNESFSSSARTQLKVSLIKKISNHCYRLYLETVMRSPHDMNDDSLTKSVYHGNFSDDDYLYSKVPEKSRKNSVRRFITACFDSCKLKKKQPSGYDVEDDHYRNYNEPRRTYSFAELELNKMMRKDAAIQTGQSLEMAQIDTLRIREFVQDNTVSELKVTDGQRKVKASISDTSSDSDFLNQLNELNVIKYLKNARSESTPSTSDEMASKATKTSPKHMDSIEEELQSHTYAYKQLHKPPDRPPLGTIRTRDAYVEKPQSSKQAVKRLRFEEETLAMSCNDVTIEKDIHERTNIAGEDQKKGDDDSKRNDESTGVGRDFKRFWKSRKSKKKAHLSLR